MINKVILTGRLTQEIELRNTNDGIAYTYFTIAVNRRNNDQTDFISCIAWRQTAELMKNYLNKGSLIGIEGRLEVFSQQKEGQFETRTTVQVSNITFLESKAQAEARTAEQNLNTNSQQPMTFAGENNFDQTQTTPVPENIKAPEQSSFGDGAETIDASDINLEEIKF